MFVNFDAVLRRDHFLAGIDRAQPFAAIRINQAKLELGHARELIPCFLNFCGVESRNLDENSIAPDRTDDRFASAEVIDAFANDLDCLVEHGFIDRLIARNEPDEKGSSALDIETERDLFLRLPDRDDAEPNEQNR